MSIGVESINGIKQRVIDSLQNDLVSVGELRQIIMDSLVEKSESRGCMTQVIQDLLAQGVEIGETRNIEGKYVKFVAWKGSIIERWERASRHVESLDQIDQDYAFWLCLQNNVDEYEGSGV